MSKIEITKVNDSIAIRKRNKDGVTFTPWTYHSVRNIRSVVPDFALNYGVVQSDNNRFNDYPYLNKLRVIFNFVSENGTTEFFDIQDVLNQPTWTADATGFNQALLDIDAWLVTSSTVIPSAPGSFTPVAILQSDMVFPYTVPAATYRAVTLVVASGETIDLDGVTLPEGTYSFSGDQGDLCTELELDNPSGTGFVLLLVQ